jgi:hypothetical protein
MKLITHFLLYLITSALVSCQESANVNCELNVSVIQNDGVPVERADVSVQYPIGIKINLGGGFPTDQKQTSTVGTDVDGKARINYKTVSSPEGLVWIKKDKFYTSIYQDHQWEIIDNNLSSQRTQINALLKPIKNPIPMVARNETGLEIKEFDKEYQFDFEVGELLPPHGKGIHPDIRVIMKGTRVDNGPNEFEDIDYQASIRFSNPLDGFIEFAVQPKDSAVGSSFISDYLAPDAGYLPTLERKAVWGKARSLPGYWEYLNSTERKAYYFRVRTQTDATGKIISAHYGKILGPLKLLPVLKNHAAFKKAIKANLSISELYFNPTPNDRNVEFDTKRNLVPDGNVSRP